jgi:2-keto-4-pentenoate hydratase/2-oxohepta-3-ene-1,7-dioic acid hydratase in catechol pathway
MKIVRYLDIEDKIEFGHLTENTQIFKITGDIFGDFDVIPEPVQVKKMLVPIMPTSIMCIGLNYRHHAQECGKAIPQYPVLFMKALSALQNPNDSIYIPRYLVSKEVDYEGELAVIIGRSCKNVSSKNALDYVLGYTCGNDVSARDWQIKYGGSQWCRGKTFDSFCPLGPHIVTTDEIGDPNSLKITTILNDEIVQNANTNDMIFKIPELIEFLSADTTLLPGTVILTGTPSGVGMASNPPRWLKSGDKIIVEIEKIGRLYNPVE